MPQAIDRNEVKRLADARAQIIDVLPKKEYGDFHLPHAIDIPLESLRQETARQLQREKPVIVYCYD